jgi:predicted DNA-binding protein (UPF0278 family)
LVEIRQKALRRGVWFKALDRIERGILSLTARIVYRVESVVLGIELAKIVRKLRDALKSGFVKRMEEFGLSFARRLAKQAVAWGYGGARSWASDLGFIRYLTSINLNWPTGFGV